MINRVFFISEQGFDHGETPAPEEGLYYSILTDPSNESSLEKAYTLIDGHSSAAVNTNPSGPFQLCLTLNIQTPLTSEQIRFISSFLFMPAYLRIDDKLVINLRGGAAAASLDALSSYLSAQGFNDPLIQIIPESDYFCSIPALIARYNMTALAGPGHDQPLFFYAPSASIRRSALTSLQEAEHAMQQQDSKLYSLIQAQQQMEKELHDLRRKYTATAEELQNQQQYVDILRSGHAAKEIQDYYNNEYESLPLWYKRFGHVLKILMGKRSLK